MSFCVECGNQINPDSSSYTCDKCKMIVCGFCADLMDTEVLCMELDIRRRLKFFCKICDESVKIALENESTIICVKGVVNNIMEELSAMNNSLEKRILNVLINMEDKMKSMKESNIDIIKLLSDSNKKPSVQNTKPMKVTFNQLTGKPNFTDAQNKIIQDCLESMNEPIQKGKEDYKQKNMGSAKVTTEDRFYAAEKKLWIYIWRVNREVNEQDVINYLQKKPECEEEDFIVKELPTKETQNKCFMVGASLKLKAIIYDNEFWPWRVGYKRFDFRKYRAYNKANKAYNRANTLIFNRSIKRE